MSVLSVDQVNQLLRFYLAWPETHDVEPDQEANEFFFWLVGNVHEEDLHEVTGGLPGVKAFVRRYANILASARYLKSGSAEGSANARDNPRVGINTHLYIMVYDCARQPELEGEIIRGNMLDMAATGLRVETKQEIPAGSIVTLVVVQTGQTLSRYQLTGEVRWSSEVSDVYHVGMSIFAIEDHKRWQDLYYVMNTLS